jgi:O-antigen ligase
MAAAAALFFWLDTGGVSKRLATAFEYSHAAEATSDIRLAMARDSLRILRDHPWMGTGLGSFRDVYPRYQSFASDVVSTYAHNDYAQALAEAGLAGGALVLLGLVVFFRRAFANLGQRLEREAGWIELGAAVGCAGLLVHGVADFNFHIPANAAWFSVCLAVAVSRSAPRTRPGPRPA